MDYYEFLDSAFVDAFARDFKSDYDRFSRDSVGVGAVSKSA